MKKSSLVFVPAVTLMALAGSASAHPGCAASASTLPPALERAMASYKVAGDPAQVRADFKHWLTYSPTCYPADLTEEQWAKIIEAWDALPPTQTPGQRFNSDSVTWVGDGLQGTGGRAQRARLTLSFAPDGTIWGLPAVSTTGPSDLDARHVALFGAGNVDRGREYYRQAFGSWRRYGGLDYQEVADSGIPMDQVVTRRATVGDLRIGGRPFGTGSFLAYNAFPSPVFAGVGGGDMCMNTSFYLAANFSNPTNRFRYLRNTVAHEHGHGSGAIHQVPCNGTKMMEPQIAVGFDMLTVDDRRGAQRSYGDRFSGNQTAATAHNLGNLTSRSAIERDLSTNGAAGALGTSTDWFRFRIDAVRTIAVTTTPTGGSYITGQQSGGCSGTTATVNAAQAGNLDVTLLNAAGTTVLAGPSTAVIGTPDIVTFTNLPVGEYTIRVRDIGPNAAVNQIVQLYDLTVRSNTFLAPPYANAGINKRVRANTNCWFMGDINSAPTEPAATIPTPAGYDWDFNGDGLFETNDNPEPFRQYTSNGVYPATLRVTDSNGQSSTDTITVTVFGASTFVTSVSPNAGNRGTSVPVTITGNNLKNVTAASMVTVSGTGVTVTGTPVPNFFGTQVTGLSFNVAAGATLGLRNITVSNADGTATGTGLFTVQGGCQADIDSNGVVDINDFFGFLSLYSANNPQADIDNNGVVNINDFFAYLTLYSVGC